MTGLIVAPATAAACLMTSPNGPTYSVELITPEMAVGWLSQNIRNRRQRKAVINRYARDMERGRWMENGAPICFDSDRRLIDGQHRLEACAQSGREFWSLVVTNLPPNAQDTLDDQAKRTMADRLQFHDRDNAHVSAAVTRRVLLWQHGHKTNTGAYQPTVAECIEALNIDPTIEIAIDQAVRMKAMAPVPGTIIGLTWWLFFDLDAQACSDFWTGLHTGASLEAGDPILAVRNQITNDNAKQSGRIPESAHLAYVIKAWNAWRADRELPPTHRFRLSAGEKFPEPK